MNTDEVLKCSPVLAPMPDKSQHFLSFLLFSPSDLAGSFDLIPFSSPRKISVMLLPIILPARLYLPCPRSDLYRITREVPWFSGTKTITSLYNGVLYREAEVRTSFRTKTLKNFVLTFIILCLGKRKP